MGRWQGGRLARFLCEVAARRARTLPPAEGLRFLFGLDAALYPVQGELAVDYGGGLHTKHRHTRYHDFFVSRIKPGERVADIGCGIGALACDVAGKSGADVVAIDLSSEELEETDNDALKIVMDATDLKFVPSTFAAATSFFTLLYVDREKQEKVFSEVHRVLRDGGRFLIWDVRIPDEAEGKPFFMVQLEVSLPDEAVTTGYGVKMAFQDMDHFKDIAAMTGFEVACEWSRNDLFHLELVKTS